MKTLERLAQLDKTIRDCEHSLTVADRLKAQGRWKAQWDAELLEVRPRLKTALRERDWIDSAILRHARLSSTVAKRETADAIPLNARVSEHGRG